MIRKDIDTESLNLQNNSPIIPQKVILNTRNFYSNTEHSVQLQVCFSMCVLISPNETPITTKSINPSTDHHKTSQNSITLTHASNDDLHAEMITLKSFVVDQLHMLKKKQIKDKFYRITKTKRLSII